MIITKNRKLHKKKLWILYKIPLAQFRPLGYIIVTKDEGPEKRIPGQEILKTAGTREHRPEADSLFEMTGNDPVRRRRRSPEEKRRNQ